EREKALGLSRKSLLGVAHQCGVPIYTSSPGDSSIGMNVAEQALTGSRLRFDPSADVNETSAIVFDAKTHGGKSAVLIIGGGSPSAPRRTARRRRTATPARRRRLSTADPEFAAPAATSRAYAAYALGLLTLINLLNYTDRNVVFALFEPIKRELVLSDQQLGWLGSAYVVVLSLAALPLGVLGDLKSRRAVIAFGVGLWSAFTALGATVSRFWQLLLGRAL